MPGIIKCQRIFQTLLNSIFVTAHFTDDETDAKTTTCPRSHSHHLIEADAKVLIHNINNKDLRILSRVNQVQHV